MCVATEILNLVARITYRVLKSNGLTMHLFNHPIEYATFISRIYISGYSIVCFCGGHVLWSMELIYSHKKTTSSLNLGLICVLSVHYKYNDVNIKFCNNSIIFMFLGNVICCLFNTNLIIRAFTWNLLRELVLIWK